METIFQSPHLLIQQNKKIFSWLGCIIFTIFVAGLSIVLCWSEISKFYKLNNPILNEESYVVAAEKCPSIFIDEQFNFSFSVKSANDSNTDFFLDETYFTPKLLLYNVSKDDNEYKYPTSFDLIPQKKIKTDDKNITTTITFFKISNLNFNETNKENRTITICPNYRTHLKLFLKPCEEGDNPNECQSETELDRALKKVKIYIKYNTSLIKYEKEIKSYLSVYESEVYERNKASNLLRTEVDFLFEHVETTVNEPFMFLGFLFPKSKFKTNRSFFHVKDEKTRVSYFERMSPEERKTDNFYIASFSYDHRMSPEGSYQTIGIKIYIKFETILELWTEIFAVFSILSSIIPKSINILFGYYDGNYYSKIINSLFQYRENEGENKKGIIKLRFKEKDGIDSPNEQRNMNKFLVGNSVEIYGKSCFSCCCENCNSARNIICNNISTGYLIDYFICKNKKKFTKKGCAESYGCYVTTKIIIALIFSSICYFIYKCLEKVKINIFLIIIPFTIFASFICCYRFKKKEECGCHSTMWYFNYGRDIVRKYIDIAFITQKLFEFEQLKYKQKYELSPKATIIWGIEPYKNEQEYIDWIKEQDAPYDYKEQIIELKTNSFEDINSDEDLNII